MQLEDSSRRLFEEHNFALKGHVLHLEQYWLFRDLENDFDIPDFRKQEMVEKAGSALTQEIPQLLASDYMLFCQ